jgi:leucyl aminopeptidase
MALRLAMAAGTRKPTDAAICFCLQRGGGAGPAPRDPLLRLVAAWRKQSAFTAKANETSLFPTWRKDLPAHVLLVGLGDERDVHPGVLRRAAAAAARAAMRQGWSRASLILNLPWTALGLSPEDAIRLIAIGFLEGSYAFRAFTGPRHEEPSLDLRVELPGPARTALAAALREGQQIGAVINRTRDLANLPGNHAPPHIIARYAQALARRSGLRCEVWGTRRLARERCGALLAVAQGSATEPQLITLRYAGRRRNRPPLVLVGKTITFDTGGVSIKPAKNMEWMKYDKCGGMTVLAAMELVGSVLRPDFPVIGILAAAENMPGGLATRPGDIVRSRSGKSIEIINTDAEGRLVLADALSVARDFKPACVIDLATLTGAASVALGRFRTPLLGNDAPLLDALRRAGERTGDRLWPLPLDREYAAMLSSPFADLKNTGDGSAGTIAGAMFLRHFVPDRLPWAHLDLTAAWEEHDTASAPAGATLFGTTLLCDWIRNGGPAELNA